MLKGEIAVMAFTTNQVREWMWESIHWLGYVAIGIWVLILHVNGANNV